jgi:hypothetical protein
VLKSPNFQIVAYNNPQAVEYLTSLT